MRWLLAVAASLAFAAPAHAQQASGRPRPDDDLRCAAWAATVLGINQDDPDAARFGMALA